MSVQFVPDAKPFAAALAAQLGQQTTELPCGCRIFRNGYQAGPCDEHEARYAEREAEGEATLRRLEGGETGC